MIEVSDIPKILKKRLTWLVIAPIIMVGLAVFYLTFKSPVYRTETEILIQPRDAEIVAGNPVSSGDPNTPGMDIDSQSYVILSAPVLNKVANALDLDNSPIFNRPRFLHRVLGMTSSGSRSSKEMRDATLARLREVIQVDRLGKSFVFQIRVNLSEPVLAAAIANETATAYIAQNRENRNNALIEASATLGQQASQLIAKVEQAEAAVVQYRSQQGLISTEGGLIVNQQIEALNSQITNARVELERARAIEEQVRPLTLADVEAGSVPQSVSTSVLTSLRVQFASISQQVAQASTSLGANHPTLRELRSQSDNTKAQISSELQRIKANVRSQYDQARATLVALEQQLKGLQSQNTSQGKALIELRRLQSEADANRAVYEAFLNRSRELEELPEIDLNATRVLSEAPVPPSPSGPKSIIVLGAAAVFGFVAAASAAVGLAVMTGQINSERSLVSQTGIPLIANTAKPNGPASAWNPLDLLFGTRQPTEQNAYRMAQARIAYTLRQAFADQRPANVLVLAVGATGDISSFVRQVAEELHDMGEEVLFAHTTDRAPGLPGPAAETKSRTNRSGSRIGALNALAMQLGQGRDSRAPETPEPFHRNNGGLSNYLRVEQIDPRRKYSASVSLDSENEDFLIIDAGSAETSPFLPVLLRHCDGIVLVTAMNTVTNSDLERTITYLDPWYDRIIGNVVI